MWFEMSIHKYDYSNDIFRIRELEFEDRIDEDSEMDIINRLLEEEE